jgi:hypothetical protein
VVRYPIATELGAKIASVIDTAVLEEGPCRGFLPRGTHTAHRISGYAGDFPVGRPNTSPNTTLQVEPTELGMGTETMGATTGQFFTPKPLPAGIYTVTAQWRDLAPDSFFWWNSNLMTVDQIQVS